MVVLVIHIAAITTAEGEGDSPVSIDVHSPLLFATAFELMKPKARRVEVTNIRCDIEPCQDSPNLGQVIRVETSRIPSLEESFQTSMLETDNHPASVTCNVSGVNQGALACPSQWALLTAGARTSGGCGGEGIRTRRGRLGGIRDLRPFILARVSVPDLSLTPRQ
jgi:hypothetical protein